MDQREFEDIRRALGISKAQLGRVLMLAHASGYKTVHRMVIGDIPISGPVTRVMQALKSGWRPADYEACLRHEARHDAFA